MSTVTAPIQIGLLLLSTTATGVICFLCGRSTICSKINNTESKEDNNNNKNARSVSCKNLFLFTSAFFAAYLMVLFFYNGNSLLRFSSSHTQFTSLNVTNTGITSIFLRKNPLIISPPPPTNTTTPSTPSTKTTKTNEKEKTALVEANVELAKQKQTNEKEKQELVEANAELAKLKQTNKKEKQELVEANAELTKLKQTKEKEKTELVNPSSRRCDVVNLRSSLANPEYYRKNYQPPSLRSHISTASACNWAMLVRKWHVPTEFFTNAVQPTKWFKSDFMHILPNGKQTLTFGGLEWTPTKTQLPAVARDGRPWGEHVFEYAEKKQLSASFFQQLFPGKGCLEAPHAKGAPETNVKDLLTNEAQLIQWDSLAKTSLNDVIHALNAARLTMRDPTITLDAGASSPSSSTLPYVPMILTGTTTTKSIEKMKALLQKIQSTVDSFEEGHLFVVVAPFPGFVPSVFFKSMVGVTERIRHVSFYFAPVDTCFRHAVLKQPSMIREQKNEKRDYPLSNGLKSFSINIQWIFSYQIAMNTIYDYNFVATLEDDIPLYRDYYLYMRALGKFASVNPIDIVSPVPINQWYLCGRTDPAAKANSQSKDFSQHLQKNYLYSSYSKGQGKGLTDMNGLMLSNISMPWGAGYTRHYAMRLAALYLGQDLSMLHMRYDVVGNSWVAGRFGRLSIAPLAARSGGDPGFHTPWDFGFPRFMSCDHSQYHVINYKQASPIVKQAIPGGLITLGQDEHDLITLK